MPIPVETQQWPPIQHRHAYSTLREWGAWYSGDPAQLKTAYGTGGGPREQGFFTDADVSRRWWSRFWRRKDGSRPNTEDSTMLHIPLPGDISTVSADMLFSEPPSLLWPDARDRQQLLDQLITEMRVHNSLLEAAEIASAFGGVFVEVAWDSDVSDFPILSPRTPDNALPSFRWGRLVDVVFWETVSKLGERVWRHLTCHTYNNGQPIIEHALFSGDSRNLGNRVQLSEHPDTAELDDVVPVPGGDLAVVYVPNMLPARTLVGYDWGRSDYDGATGVYDALDETWSSWMRDIRLGKARLIVPAEFLERDGRGQGARFDTEQEVFHSLDIDPSLFRDSSGSMIQAEQFAIRVDEHARTAAELIERAISNAGHSPQSYGLRIEGRAESGTALNVRQRRSYATTAKKQRYWQPEIVRLLLVAQRVAAERLGLSDYAGESMQTTVEWPDESQPDMATMASSLQMLAAAEAVSTEMKVRMLHPDWDDDQIMAEVQRITSDRPSVVDPFAAESFATADNDEETDDSDDQ